MLQPWEEGGGKRLIKSRYQEAKGTNWSTHARKDSLKNTVEWSSSWKKSNRFVAELFERET